MEIWKTIIDSANPNEVYEVSDLGRARSLDQIVTYRNAKGSQVSYKRKGRILRAHNNGSGHKYVSLGLGDNKRRAVHRLVAKAFIPNPDNKPEVNHIDCDPANNAADNLEWVTHAENMRYCHDLGRGFAKLRKAVIGKNLKTGEQKIYESARAGAVATGCSWKHISSCCLGKRKSTGGYAWRFIKNN